jgi:hypothetical protein
MAFQDIDDGAVRGIENTHREPVIRNPHTAFAVGTMRLNQDLNGACGSKSRYRSPGFPKPGRSIAGGRQQAAAVTAKRDRGNLIPWPPNFANDAPVRAVQSLAV